MAKTISKPSPKKASASTKNKASGNAKKQPAKSKMITSMDDIMTMSVGDFAKSLNRINYDIVDYEVEEYTRKHGDKALHEALLITDPKKAKDAKKTFLGETTAIGLANAAEADPVGFVLSFIAYKRGIPTAN